MWPHPERHPDCHPWKFAIPVASTAPWVLLASTAPPGAGLWLMSRAFRRSPCHQAPPNCNARLHLSAGPGGARDVASSRHPPPPAAAPSCAVRSGLLEQLARTGDYKQSIPTSRLCLRLPYSCRCPRECYYRRCRAGILMTMVKRRPPFFSWHWLSLVARPGAQSRGPNGGGGVQGQPRRGWWHWRHQSNSDHRRHRRSVQHHRTGCTWPGNPSNGSVSVPSYTSGRRPRNSCTPGFALSGSATRTCQTDGTWSAMFPTCVRG